jgi:DNA polymerase-3 subunit epsilon
MTGGQTSLSLAGNASDGHGAGEGSGSRVSEIRRLPADRQPARIIRATQGELEEHAARLQAIAKAAGAPALWTQLTV